MEEGGSIRVVGQGIQLCKLLREGQPPLLLDMGGLTGTIGGNKLSLRGQGSDFVAVSGDEQLSTYPGPPAGNPVQLTTHSYTLAFDGPRP